MRKEKIQKILEEKIGHKWLFGIGVTLLLVANTLFLFISYVDDLKYVFYSINFLLILVGASAIFFASEIKQKNNS